MLKKVDVKEAAKVREERILSFWKENAVFQKSEQLRQGGQEFVFYEGPPTANGRPHPGHVLTRVMKDVYPRYRTMKGCHVVRKAGWDTHGLPVEIEIEKKFGISGKKQIEEFGVERFIQECKNSVFTYEQTWREMTEKLGYWIDLDHPYITLEDDYIESVWHLLKRIFDKGYLYQGHRVSPYCPHCETTLSSHEVAQGYKDVKDLTLTAKFKVQGQDDVPTFVLAWTTTPWTLPGNVALAVNSDLTYVLIHANALHERYWVADSLKGNFMLEEDLIIDRKSGSDLLGLTYEPVFPYANEIAGRKFEIVTSNHVSDESGTGVVHMAPAFGEDDYRVCKDHGIIFCNFVNYSGHFTDDVTDYAGRFVKDEDLNVDLVKSLAARGLLYEKHKFEHAYPHCWRCDTPLLYYAIDSWFIKTTAVKEQMINNSRGINWMPEHIKEGRMGNFLENLIDWNLSRSRYWGTPLPVWKCNQCGHTHCVGSKEELQSLTGRLPQELHKPFIDELSWSCTCGGAMERAPEVIDVWFDSGSMPFAQLHYPFEHEEDFKRLYPADYICEAVDQTRGWFYALLAISTLVTGEAPYKNVLVLGHVLDENGKKMSKSKGNVIDPFEAFDRHGADALRFYFLSNTQPWNSQLFYHTAVAESKAKFIDLIQNIHAFYALYAGLDHFRPQDHKIAAKDRPLMDRWIIARLHDAIAEVDNRMDSYDATAAVRTLQAFVDELSTWYVRRNRERFWAAGMEVDKISAYLTMYECLSTIASLAAPFIPFLAEELYQNVVRGAGVLQAPESVHLCDYPIANTDYMDRTLIQEMADVLSVVERARHLRNESKIKTRQPLSAIYLPLDTASVIGKFADIIKDELNVKTVNFTALSDIAKPELYLNLKQVGKVFGSKLPSLNQAAKQATSEQIAVFQEKGQLEFDGEIITRDHAELRYQSIFPGLLHVTSMGFVGLTTELTPELIEEGYVREIISKMQMMRKEVNYNVIDKVAFYAEGDNEILRILNDHFDEIAATVLIRELIREPMEGDLTKVWDVNGKLLKLSISRRTNE
ncbi:MAG: isoleucyl-tRNA synthetase [Bacilli bacterium]|nr:isoleucyl-tRNA synthetase [Bacilli bacterium]